MGRLVGFFIIFSFVIHGNASEPKPISIDLKRMPSPLKVLMANHHNEEYRPILDHLKTMKISNNTSNETVPLFKFLDYEFYGEVLIGHPGQKFRVVFDTTWSDLWVPSVRCPVSNIACILRNKYDHKHSPSYVPTGKKFNVDFGRNNLSGDISMDLLHVAGMNITNQTFGEVDQIPYKEFLFSKADGVFGLSFNTYAMDGITPFFYNMVSQKRIPRAIFSIYLNRDLSTDKGGTLLFGGIESRHYRGDFTYVPVDPRSGMWQFEAKGISVKGSNATFCQGGCHVVADSGSNEIRGPKQEIEAINDIIQARTFHFDRYIVDCGKISKLPKITIKIGGKDFALKGPQYIQQISYGPGTICLSSFSINPPGATFQWVLGGAFLSRYYSVYNLEKYTIGFADAL